MEGADEAWSDPAYLCIAKYASPRSARPLHMGSEVRTVAGNAEKGGRRRWSLWRLAGWAAGALMLLLAL
ncbi:MAG: hypothetical protein VX992_07655, partial [Acidobacteriota bacterium]|nr:hypothetical protein [Acidobacteriota bacterium]